MTDFISIRDLTPRTEWIKGEVSSSPMRVTQISQEWREKLEAVEPDRNVRITEGEHVLFEGTAAELLAQLEAYD